MRADIGLFELMYLKGDLTFGQYIGITILVIVIVFAIFSISIIIAGFVEKIKNKKKKGR